MFSLEFVGCALDPVKCGRVDLMFDDIVHFDDGSYFQAQKVSDDLLQKIGSKNRRALDLVAAKCYYYHARVYEFLNQFDTIRRYTYKYTLTHRSVLCLQLELDRNVGIENYNNLSVGAKFSDSCFSF